MKNLMKGEEGKTGKNEKMGEEKPRRKWMSSVSQRRRGKLEIPVPNCWTGGIRRKQNGKDFCETRGVSQKSGRRNRGSKAKKRGRVRIGNRRKKWC